MKKTTLLFLMTLFSLLQIKAQNFELVKDINLDGSFLSAEPKHIVEFKNKLYFSAVSPKVGRELHSYDGTTHQLVANLKPDEYNGTFAMMNAKPTHLTPTNNYLYFIATNTVDNDSLKLFKYDGNNAPTEIFTFEATSNTPYWLMLYTFNNKVYYTNRNYSTGNWELWEYDGNGTHALIFTQTATSTNGNVTTMTSFNNKLYFYAYGIWEYDGSNAPTLKVNGGGANNTASNMFVFDNAIYFTRYMNGTGRELYKYDGINAPSLVQDFNVGTQSSSINEFVVYNNEMYFSANNGTQHNLWKTDGNNLTVVDSAQYAQDFEVYNNKLYFRGFSTDTIGFELYQYDGNNVSIVEDFWQGTFNSNGTIHPYNSSPSFLTHFKNKLYFSATNGTIGVELYQYDDNNISLAANIYNGSNGSGIRNFIKYKNKLYFSAYSMNYGSELWSVDDNGANLVMDIYTGLNGNQPNSGAPNNFFIFKDTLYFKATDITGSSIWQYDGINTPTKYNIIENGSNFKVINDVLYYNKNSSSTGYELWKYDGVNAPSLVADISPGTNGSFPRNFTSLGNKIIFVASDTTHGEELWQYDGTNPPTLVADINPGNQGADIYEIVEFNGKIYFGAYGSLSDGYELWQYDGVNTPSMAFDLTPGVFANGSGYHTNPSGLTVFNNKLHFRATDTTAKINLWSYDGSNPPTQITTYPKLNYNNYMQFSSITEINNSLYFWINNSTGLGFELYKYNGVNAPTIVSELNVGLGNSMSQTPSNIVALNGYLYTSANDGIVGGPFGTGELYKIQICTPINIQIAQTDTLLVVDTGFSSYQWYNNNGIIAGETNHSFIATTDGNYYCIVSNATHCVGKSDTANVSITSVAINDIDFDNLKVYPNPSNDVVNIETKEVINSIKLFSIAGKEIKVFNANQKQLDIRNISKGIYFLELKNKEKKSIIKLIKQ